MEFKEHVFLILIWPPAFLPIAAWNFKAVHSLAQLESAERLLPKGIFPERCPPVYPESLTVAATVHSAAPETTQQPMPSSSFMPL
jgi:hypothetical protein